MRLAHAVVKQGGEGEREGGVSNRVERKSAGARENCVKVQSGWLTDWERRLAMVSNQALPTEKYSAPVSTPRANPPPSIARTKQWQ